MPGKPTIAMALSSAEAGESWLTATTAAARHAIPAIVAATGKRSGTREGSSKRPARSPARPGPSGCSLISAAELISSMTAKMTRTAARRWRVRSTPSANPATAIAIPRSRTASPGFRPLVNTTAATTTKSGGVRRRSHRWAASCCARARRSVARATLAGESALTPSTLGGADPQRHHLQAETRSTAGWIRSTPGDRAPGLAKLQPRAVDVPVSVSHALTPEPSQAKDPPMLPPHRR